MCTRTLSVSQFLAPQFPIYNRDSPIGQGIQFYSSGSHHHISLVGDLNRKTLNGLCLDTLGFLGSASIDVNRVVGGVCELQPITPMLLTGKESERRATSLYSTGPDKTLIVPVQTTTATQSLKCTPTHGFIRLGSDLPRIPQRVLFLFLNTDTNSLSPVRISPCQISETINNSEKKSQFLSANHPVNNDGSMSQTRSLHVRLRQSVPEKFQTSWTLLQLSILFLMLTLLPTTQSASLGLSHTKQSASLRSPPPYYDPGSTPRDNENSPPDDQTIKIRTRDVAPSPLTANQEGAPIDPMFYNAPALGPNAQRTPYSPVFIPNYNYYTMYGGGWGYPETRLLSYGSAYVPPPPPQWPQQQYYPRPPGNQRRKPSGRRRKDKSKGDKCPKVCDSCIKQYDNGGLSFSDADTNTERAALQRRFSQHVKPSMRHKDSVQALFKYMDGNSKF
ncbi:unnamed protein product [Mesocestoides corti]|uniref:Uncharacterized protein n=1 Tax=Mesocestoides corti TaxID=53468 RepID=A0A3P6GKA4_MESCO|nr:unnamed protein product [Mesocestoides corti]